MFHNDRKSSSCVTRVLGRGLPRLEDPLLVLAQLQPGQLLLELGQHGRVEGVVERLVIALLGPAPDAQHSQRLVQTGRALHSVVLVELVVDGHQQLVGVVQDDSLGGRLPTSLLLRLQTLGLLLGGLGFSPLPLLLSLLPLLGLLLRLGLGLRLERRVQQVKVILPLPQVKQGSFLPSYSKCTFFFGLDIRFVAPDAAASSSALSSASISAAFRLLSALAVDLSTQQVLPT